jgi:uncharacterized protein (TIGR03435 family)
MMRQLWTLFVLFVALSTDARPQDAAPSFEVASVKRNTAGPTAPNGFFPSPGRFRATNMTLEQLIHAAFRVPSGALFGATPWMESERFDIDATTPSRSDFDQELVMLRALLADRFQLLFHRETRALNSQVLVIAKKGPRFQASQDQDQKEHVVAPAGEISGTAIPFGHFVTLLAAQLGYRIVNETGLAGKYDLSLKYATGNSPDADGPSVYVALEEQLGLKLETRKDLVEVMVIDSVSRLREN